MSQLSVGDVTIWDFGFLYNLALMDIPELEVLMIKFEVELRRASRAQEERYWQITEILGKLYREIMDRKKKEYLEKRFQFVELKA